MIFPMGANNGAAAISIGERKLSCENGSRVGWHTCAPAVRVPINRRRIALLLIFPRLEANAAVRRRSRSFRLPQPGGWGEGGRFAARMECPARRTRIETVTTISAAEPSRRDFLLVATGTVAAVGAAAALVPLIGQMEPDASTIAAGAPLDVNLAPIAEGQIVKVFWRSKPIFIFHRSKRDIDSAREVNWHTLPDPAPDSARVQAGHEQWLVLIGICTHLGCIPLAHQGTTTAGSAVHGSQYDTSGRIRQGPAPLNLALPPYQFVSDTNDPDRRNRARQSIRFDHERTFDLQAAKPLHAVAGAAAADREPGLFVLHHLSDAAQSELLVDVRRHPHLHARRADRDRHRAGDALHAACRLRVQLRRIDHARRQLRLAAALSAFERRLVVLRRRLCPHARAACITAPTRSRARCCGFSASSCSC